jgi:DNA-binding PadR family transcriptional regulator
MICEIDVNEMPSIGKKMRQNILTLIILRHISKKNSYPYELLSSIRKTRHPLLRDVSKNDIYNTIKSLENGGFIEVASSAKKGGKIYYGITEKGRSALHISKKMMVSFMRSVSRILNA